MEEFNYGIEFYKRNLFNIADELNFGSKVREAEKLEKMFLEKNGNIDLIRENILISYYLDKEIKDELRYQYIRGIIYSRQYIDYTDVEKFKEELEKEFEANNLSDTLFSIKTSTTCYDDELFANYLAIQESRDSDKTEKEVEDITKMIKDELEKNHIPFDIIVETEDADSLEEQIYEDEDCPNVYTAYSLTCYEKINMFDEKFEIYLKGIISQKQIDKLSENEQRMIYKGAYDWFNKMIKDLKDAYNFQEKMGKYNSRILSLNI